MLWRATADLLAIFHLAWGAMVLIWGPLAWARPRWRPLAAAWLWTSAAAIRFYCPLSALENAVRLHYAPDTAYAEGFLFHHVAALAAWDPDMSKLRLAFLAWAVLWSVVYAASFFSKRSASK